MNKDSIQSFKQKEWEFYAGMHSAAKKKIAFLDKLREAALNNIQKAEEKFPSLKEKK